LGVVLSDQVIHGINKTLGSHIISKKSLSAELAQARHFFDIYKKKNLELKKQLDKKERK